MEEKSVQVSHENYDAETKLNLKQEVAFTIIMEIINLGKNGAFFIDGPRGTGKTFLYQALFSQVRLRCLIVLATATSNLASAILPEGRTSHSQFVLPLNLNDTDFYGFSKQDGTTELLQETSLIIWDEAPMAKRFAIEMVDRNLRDIMDSTENFGGKVIVFGGDFRQVLPVVPHGTRA